MYLLALMASIVSGFAQGIVAMPRQDEEQIRELQVQQAATWNRHDAAAYANLFTEDGDVVNVVGW